MNLYTAAVKRPVIVMIGLITLVSVGAISAYKLPIEFLPQVEFPFIGVFVPYRNSHPDYIQRNIAKPVEEVLSTLGDVKSIFSNSTDDGAFVGVEFNWGRDVGVLRMEVKEKLDQIRGELPADVDMVNIFTFDSNDIPILEGRIAAKGIDLSGSYNLLERSVVNPLKRIEGVGSVNIDGVEPKQISIYLNLDKLKAHSVDVGRLFQNLQGANMNASAGEVTHSGLRYAVRSVGTFNEFEQVENLVVSEEGLRLKDIADIYYGEPAMTYGRYLGREKAVAFWIQKASNANTVEVAQKVQAALDKINADPAMKGISVLLFFDQSEEILNGVRGLRQAGIIGGFFAVFVLYFFLRRLTTTLIVAVAIPFSIVCTLAFLYFTNRTLNMLTMMGLMLGVGMLVDNAIVVLESIFRHQSEEGTEPVKASIIGTKEVAVAVTAATFTSVIVFAPIVFSSGSDELFVWLSSVGVTISAAILFSLLISLTMIPFLTSRFLKPKKAKPSAVLAKLQDGYVRALKWTTLKHPGITSIIAIAMLAGTVGIFNAFLAGGDDDDSLIIRRIFFRLDFADNVDYKRTGEYIREVEDSLYAHQDELDMKTVYSYYRDNLAQSTVYFNDEYLTKEQLREKRKQIRDMLPEFAGVNYLLGDNSGGSGGGAQMFSVNIFGEDKQTLEDIANEAKRRFEYIDDFTDVKTSVELGRSEIEINVDRDAASRFNLTSSDITQVMGMTFRGIELNRFQAKEREVPMYISLDPSDRVGIHNLENLLVSVTDEGQDITLGAIADFQEARGPTQITRRNQKTTVSVQGLYEGDESGELREEMTAIMNNLEMPTGYSWSYSQRIQERDQQKSHMMSNILLAVLCVYMLMAALFESFMHPWVIMSCLPFAFVGVVIALAVTGTAMGIMAFIGCILLVGIVVNNGIVLVDHINNYRKQGLTMEDAILAGGRERFRPIVMTAATTILGLLPMAIGSARIGDAQYYPLARAVMGGLISSTALTLLVVPTNYVLAERLKNWSARLWVRSSQPRERKSKAKVQA